MFQGDEAVHTFHNGNLHLKCLDVHKNWTNSPLFQIAERINPKRTFLFVSTILGKHIPVKPSIMALAYKDLFNQFPILNGQVTVVGMAETAVGLGAGVFSEIKNEYANAIYLCSTRFRIPNQPILSKFIEEHSHAQDQIIHSSTDSKIHNAILNTETLILIDDEITTGKTLKNVVSSLKSSGLNKVKHIVVVSLVSWSGNKDIDFALPDVNVDSVDLFKGQYAWEAIENSEPPKRAMPFSNLVGFPNQPITSDSTWGRIPTQSVINAPDLSHVLSKLSLSKKYLVLGTNEYLWLPYLLAKALEDRGNQVSFSSTTRSPVLNGIAIDHTKTFADNYGQGIQNFAYNINLDLYDEILIVIETPISSVDPKLLSELGEKAKVINLTQLLNKEA